MAAQSVAALVPPQRPDHVVAQSLGFGPGFGVLVAEPAHQSAAIQGNPRRPFAVLQKEVHRCAGQPVGLANQLPTARRSSRQPLRGGHIDLAIPIHQDRRVARPRAAARHRAGQISPRLWQERSGRYNFAPRGVPCRSIRKPRQLSRGTSNPASGRARSPSSRQTPNPQPYHTRSARLDRNSVDVLRAAALAGNRIQAKLALSLWAGRRRHQQAQGGSDVEIAPRIRSDGERAVARTGPDRLERIPFEPRQPLGGAGPDLAIRRLVQRRNLHARAGPAPSCRRGTAVRRSGTDHSPCPPKGIRYCPASGSRRPGWSDPRLVRTP